MLSLGDFEKKQIVIIFFNEGDKLSFSNDNIIVKDADGKVKLQTSCYRIFIIFCIGGFSITSVLINQSKRFGFLIALMTTSFRLLDVIGFNKDGNTLLKKRQYTYEELGIAKLIIKNKVYMQQKNLKDIRRKGEELKEAILVLDGYMSKIDTCNNLNEIMAYEGLAAKLYFAKFFSKINWNGRQPRIKRDYINATLDIGYTILFSFIEALLISYGFDVYCGVLHKQFYMRKSLVCDIEEPFRYIIELQLKKAINLNQIKEEHFNIINDQYQLKIEHSKEYSAIFIKAILENKEKIFLYVQSYYRAFIKDVELDKYPFYKGELL